MAKKSHTTKKQVIETLTDILVGDDKAPNVIRIKLLDKLEGVSHNSSKFEITFNEGNGFYTDFRVTISEGELYKIDGDE